ncbi:MAG: hypothetical protein JWM82_1731 [Myxococcales bacterium]|nr:hypothetical protein [Myxococcales bacterium]
MSDHGHGSGGGDSDAVDYSKVVGVGVASLAIFAIAIWWASMIYHSTKDATEAKTGKARAVETKTMPAEIGIVDQVPFASDHRLPKWRAERQAHLNGYGWVDRSKGIVHIPIDQALQQVASGASPAGAPK